MSMTATSVAWVLLDGQGRDAATLDKDAFDVQSSTDGTTADTAPHTAAVRGAQTIATTSGHKVGSVRVTWTEDVEGDVTLLLKSLADLGFDNVRPVPLSKATQAWGIEIGRENELTKSGLCILEPDAATVMIVATEADTVRTAVTDTRETTWDLIEWLRTVLRRDEAVWLPERLYVLGAPADLDEVLKPIADALPIPVSDSADIQLALARGAALATVSEVDALCLQAAETVAMATVSTEPRVGVTRNERPWLAAHAKKVTIAAAAVAVFGAGLSLAAGSAINIDNTSAQARAPAAQAAAPAAEGASVISASVHTAPAPRPASSVPQVQSLAAPPPAPPAPPKTLAPPPAEVVPEPLAIPERTISASPPADVTAAVPITPPSVAPLAVPAAPQLVAPLGAPPGPQLMPPLGVPPGPQPMGPLDAPPAPHLVTPLGAPPGPEPVAPFAVPAAPQLVAPLGPPPGPESAAPQPLAAVAVPAAPAPIAPPPAAPLAAPPAPIAPPPAATPVTPETAEAAPPPNPVQAFWADCSGGCP
jgi:hypothetical protein